MPTLPNITARLVKVPMSDGSGSATDVVITNGDIEYRFVMASEAAALALTVLVDELDILDIDSTVL